MGLFSGKAYFGVLPYFTSMRIFNKCIHCQRRKHACGKQQQPLKEFIVTQTDLERIPNPVVVISKHVKNTNSTSHIKNPQVLMIFNWK